ncbi:hypothetical protein [Streptomyces sviceus]|uniref:hypothetical protein n=1 Tax=Streptomyces sviceus TaxID=285530 RepID=UPI00367F4015
MRRTRLALTRTLPLPLPSYRELTSATPTADHPKPPRPTPANPPTRPPHAPRPREATT